MTNRSKRLQLTIAELTSYGLHFGLEFTGRLMAKVLSEGENDNLRTICKKSLRKVEEDFLFSPRGFRDPS
jgi:hypothetical protein